MLTKNLLRQALLRPDHVAVAQSGRAIDYGTLVARAAAFARRLQKCGIAQGDRVAVVFPKSIEALIAVVGSSLAGAVFVPCDPRMPPERLVRILHDCDPRVVVSTTRFIDRLYQVDPAFFAGLVHVIAPERCTLSNALEHDFESSLSEVDFPSTAGDQPAYILYTSGSTGEPKGVVHSHDSANSFVNWAIERLHVAQTSVVANHAQWSFDLSVFDLWVTLATGARVELVPDEFTLRPKEFVRALRDWHVTHFYAVPSLVALLASEGGLEQLSSSDLRHLLYAGEPFPIPALRAAMQSMPQARFYNLFGPTETNVCLYYELPSIPDADAHQVPIGKPCEHLTVELLDEGCVPVAHGAEGEICVAGASVLNEYFRRPQATEGAFFAGHNFADGRPRYRTGDRASIDENGSHWFHGRRDRLVKRRGFRVELGEIESVVCTEPNVREAAAYAVHTNGETSVRVAVVLREGCAITRISLKAHCGRLLAAYMIPDAFDVMSELPRTPNGKVDLQRLGDISAV